MSQEITVSFEGQELQVTLDTGALSLFNIDDASAVIAAANEAEAAAASATVAAAGATTAANSATQAAAAAVIAAEEAIEATVDKLDRDGGNTDTGFIANSGVEAFVESAVPPIVDTALDTALPIALETALPPLVEPAVEEALVSALPPLIAGKANIELDDVVFAPTSGGAPSGAQAFRFLTGDRSLRPEDYFDGAYTYGESGSDWTFAINAMEADANPGDECVFNPVEYRYTSPLAYARQAMRWKAPGTTFLYDPPVLGDPTADALQLRQDALQFGNFVDVQLAGCSWEGFTVKCTRQMLQPYAIPAERPARTDGVGYRYASGLRFNNVVRSSVKEIFPDGQADSGNLYNAIFFNCVDQVTCKTFVPRGSNVNVTVVGQADEPGPIERPLGAGLYIDDFKIGGAETGLLCGGGFGGLGVGKGDIAGNARGVVIDQSVCNEPNREVMFSTGTSIDVSTEVGLLIDQDDARLFVNLGGMWIASSTGPGVHIKRCPNGRVTGPAYLYQNTEQGLLLEAPEAFVTGIMTCVNNGGYGVEATGTANGLACVAVGYNNGVGGAQLMTAAATQVHRMESYKQFIETLETGRIEWDTGDYDDYDQGNNERTFNVGGGPAFKILGDGGHIEIGGGLQFYIPDAIVSATNGSGVLSVAHGITSGSNRIVAAWASLGAIGGTKSSVTLDWDGTNVGGTGLPVSTRAVITMIVAKNDV